MANSYYKIAFLNMWYTCCVSMAKHSEYTQTHTHTHTHTHTQIYIFECSSAHNLSFVVCMAHFKILKASNDRPIL